jgi:hypothetical protein
MGTENYMSPEAKNGQLSPAADIYSFGVCFDFNLLIPIISIMSYSF